MSPIIPSVQSVLAQIASSCEALLFVMYTPHLHYSLVHTNRNQRFGERVICMLFANLHMLRMFWEQTTNFEDAQRVHNRLHFITSHGCYLHVCNCKTV